MHGHDHAERGIDVLELFARQAESDIVHARASVLHGHGYAKQTQVGHLRQDLRVERVRAVQFLDPRRNFAACPLAHGLLEQALFFSEIEIKHAGHQHRLRIMNLPD